jgi:hypothetical protein
MAPPDLVVVVQTIAAAFVAVAVLVLLIPPLDRLYDRWLKR